MCTIDTFLNFYWEEADMMAHSHLKKLVKKIPTVWCARLKTGLIISDEWSDKTNTFIAHELDNLSSPQASFGQIGMRADLDAEGFGGGRGSRGSPPV